MAQAAVVADASVLIGLGWVDQLPILPGLFGRIVIPPAVAGEVAVRGAELQAGLFGRPLEPAPEPRCGGRRER